MTRTIGIATPNFNRCELLFNSFSKVINNENVAEVTIVDDCSNQDIYNKIEERAKENPKIKLYRNSTNLDCYFNKYASISHSTEEWCCLWDSDNGFDNDYIQKLLQLENWNYNTAYLPSFAMPHFDYRKFEGLEITAANVHQYMDDPTFTCCLNTANYFVNRHFYMKCWDGTTDPHTSDSIYMNYLWLRNGGKLYIVPGLSYQHRVDDHQGEENGHYNTNVNKTPAGFHDSVINRLKELR